ncbi:MAG: amino acid adenylation domain-containing protein, partial [Acidobacteria bacterium]|nr:amino acid adenylation domain-containing protein [Acidobacteriota bacterium]
EEAWPSEKEGGQVGLLIAHGVDMIAAILGVLKSGSVYVPLSPDYPTNRVSYILEDSESRLLLTDSRCEEKAGKIAQERGIPFLNIDKIEKNEAGPSETIRKIAGEKQAYIMYTSGSTGKPKGVVQTHQNVLYYIHNWIQRFSITEADRMTLFSSFCHDGSVQDMFSALLTGAALYPYDVRKRDDNVNFTRFLSEEKITIWHSVPSLFNFFVNTLTGSEHFEDLRWLLLGGEPFRGYEIDMFKKHFPGARLADVYGQTESSVNSIWTISAADPIPHLIIGEPLDNTRIFIIDEDGNPVEPLEIGEIVVACPHISPGYWRNEELTKQTFDIHPEYGPIYWTGDLGRLLVDGNIEFMGRKDFQVKIRGFRVEIGEIETALLHMEQIKEAVVVAKVSETGNTYLCAFFTSEKEVPVTGLREALADELPDYMIPLHFMRLEKMPLTQSGKIDRKNLLTIDIEPLKISTVYTAPQTGMEQVIAGIWREVLKQEDIGIHDNLFEAGGNSFDLIKINGQLSQMLQINISMVKLFEYPTIHDLASYLEQQAQKGSGTKVPAVKEATIKELDKKRACSSVEIAVIGMAGRFPGAKNIAEFWENIKNGSESLTFFSDEELIKAGIPGETVKNPNYIKSKGLLGDIDLFDASFFNYTHKEAEVMDPQLRIFHECAWEAIEQAGYSLYDKKVIGLYAGNLPNHHWMAHTFLKRQTNPLGAFETNILGNHFSTHISYKLDLTGPSITVRTACSTSLVAIHMACQGLILNECEMALAGGVSISYPPKSGYFYQEGMIFSSDGHVRAFDNNSQGTVFGDGAGCVVLKRLAGALADGDCIYAVIKGSAMNNDGIKKVGYTAPGVGGQREVIRAAQEMAGVDPESIGFMEFHGTGTALGDAVEFEAVERLFPGTQKGYCAIGSVKSNVGHLNAAAGVAGFIKAVLSLKHQLIPPSINFEIPNPQIDFIDSPFYINTTLTPWQPRHYPLRAGVSSFGLGGTNAHVVLEEAPHKDENVRQAEASGSRHVIVLSAKTKPALARMKENLALFLQKNPTLSLADVSYTLQKGRQIFKYQWAASCTSIAEAIAVLTSGPLEQIYEPTPQEALGETEGIRYRLSLPTYPFEHERYVIDEEFFKIDASAISGVPTSQKNSECFYVPSWKPAALPLDIDHKNVLPPGVCRLLFMNDLEFTARLLKHLEQSVGAVIYVKAGSKFAKESPGFYTINPQEAGDYDALLRDLQEAGLVPGEAIHLWNITGDNPVTLEFEGVQRRRELGLNSLIHLAQACENRENPIQITIITNNMQSIRGEEIPCPAKALILAAVKMIPRLFPSVKCRSLDITVPGPGSWQEARLYKQIAAELGHDYPDPVVAYRGHARLVESWEAIPLKASAQETRPQLKKGVYLVTGGLEGIGFEISRHLVQYLASTPQAKLILIEPPGSLTHRHGRSLDINLYAEIPFLQEAETRINQELGLRDLDSFAGMEETFNRLCSAYILDYFKKRLPGLAPGHVYDKKNLQEKLGIIAKFERFYNFFIKTLASDGSIRVDNDHIEFLPKAATVEEPRRLSDRALEKYPGFSGTVRVLDYCTSHYCRALSGEIDALTVLYPEGNYIKNEAQYLDSVQHSKEELYMLLLKELVVKVIKQTSMGRTIRILEIGAGQGILTRKLIPVLKNQNVEYHFTDIGHFFIVNAKKEAAQQGLDFMHFKKLDISNDPTEEGFDTHSFDMILGLNVVHMAKQIKPALLNLKRLLVPNGIIALVEITDPKRWRHMVNGLAEGWWFFEDTDLRQDSSLLSLNTWEEVFKSLEFRDVYSFPRDNESKLKTNCGLIVARHGHEDCRENEQNTSVPAGLPDRKNEHLAELRKIGVEIQVMEVDFNNQVHMQEWVNQVEAKSGKITGVIYCAGFIENKNGTGENNQGIKHVLTLDKVLASNPLDFFAICSFLDPFDNQLNTIGELAAVYFYNSFTQHKLAGMGRPFLSIDWGPSVSLNTRHIIEAILEHSFAQVIFSNIAPCALHTPTGLALKAGSKEKPNTADVKKYQRPELSSVFIAPRDNVETVIAGIWQEFLGIEQVGIDDDFMELGADSLSFITIAANIQKKLHINVTMEAFFNTGTTKRLAEYIHNAHEDAYLSVEPVEKREYYEISSAQQRLYFLHHMDPESTTYNIPIIMELEGNPDKEIFKNIFLRLAQRHENLRTSFQSLEKEGKGVVQKVHEQFELLFEYYEVDESKARERIKCFIKPFDLSRTPLFRVAFIRIDAQHSILLVDIHHIISDGVSLDVLQKEFKALYAGEDLPPLKLQYKDFAAWHKGLLESSKIKDQETYWLNIYNDEIPVLNLPTDYPRPAVQVFAGDRTSFTISSEDFSLLKAILIKEKVTLFMMLTAIWNILLAKLSGQEDVVLGTLTSGRRHPDLEPVIGMFVNTLALRSFPANYKTIREFLQETKDSTLRAFENQDYQFEDLVEKLPLVRDVSRNPLFDVLFTLQLQNTGNDAGNTAETENKDSKQKNTGFEWKVARFDLTLSARETGDFLHFVLEYSTTLFKEETIARFIGYFKEVISRVLKDMAVKIAEIEIITAEEKKQVLYDFNQTDTGYPQDKTIPQLFSEQAAQSPDHIAVIGPSLLTAQPGILHVTYVTYRELDALSNRLSHHLKEKISTDNTVIGIMTERSVEMIGGILGILKAGAAYLPIDPDYPQERIEYMLKDSGASILIKINKFEARSTKFETNPNVQNSKDQNKNADIPIILDFGNLDFEFVSDFGFRISNFNSSNFAYVIYTSGSTGKPKGVMVEHRSVVNLIHTRAYRFKTGTPERVLLAASICFDASIEQIFAALFFGNVCVVAAKETLLEKELLDRFLKRHAVTYLSVVPSILAVISEDNNILKEITVGGEPCPVPLARQWSKRCIFYNEYGPTETTVTALEKKITAGEENTWRLPLGKPIPNVRIFILDAALKVVPLMVTGELFIEGAGVARGYLNNPELTAEKFNQDLLDKNDDEDRKNKSFFRGLRGAVFSKKAPLIYKTGDLARWLTGGDIEFLGRVDHQVKIRGYRIELEEIQNLIVTHHAIREAVVLCLENLPGDKYIAAYFVAHKTLSRAELAYFLAGQLPDYMMPAYFIQVDRIPITANGKVDRSALPQPGINNEMAVLGPRDALE